MVVLVDAQAVADRERRVPREDGRARIALLVGIVPERLVTVECKIDLPLLELGLLKAEEVGVERGERLGETLVAAGAQPVDVP